MKSLWIFRSNIRNYEYYHSIKDLESFKRNCHDFYLLQGIKFLELNFFDEIIIWRLGKKNEEIIFNVNGKNFIQRFVKTFTECFKYPNPTMSFFRGGFPEYCEVIKINPKFFGLKIYLGAGKRVVPIYGGHYDKILFEDERDAIEHSCNFLPFYKTANEQIFFPKKIDKKYDICFPANFSQITYKGQEKFIRTVSRSKQLRKLKIVHIGNKPHIGKELCKNYSVDNIDFLGYLGRNQINDILNMSYVGLVNSNMTDGCPRVITEILMSGLPLILSRSTRIPLVIRNLPNIFTHDDNNFINIIEKIKKDYLMFEIIGKENINGILNLENICIENYKVWSSN